MYIVAVRRDFIAQHFLIGGDWGPENQQHSHHYEIELQLQGNELDQNGFLVDIVEIERVLEAVIARFRNQTLNNLHEFAGLNPSIEHFSRILCDILALQINAPNIRRVKVSLWENEIAWAAYDLER